ncbi:MAG: nucleoside-diphosphate kinase [Candidatus Marinimicrobia bacterium]|jgi:nucleoside-diphosphate kinase|nr:nucleoside-diphosphate kinase [Candidatus Neomarinimicrobiota bacterium]MDP6611721.1 nucleoside-diphosphate kinase [Candidatus Neomarinimicrobiota bacterium]|tara:strand:+ start:50748 stop:51173 length:426 start_codon:yes stop_codon:yes gene_type:complete
MGNRTFAMIKPDAIRNGHLGKIFDRVISAGFKVLGAKLIRMTKAQAEGFYAIHRERPFFEDLTTFMSSGQTMVLALEKENAVAAWRETIGATNPAEAAEGSIRKDFATSLGENAVHGADSDENALIEIGFFFTESDLISNQ